MEDCPKLGSETDTDTPEVSQMTDDEALMAIEKLPEIGKMIANFCLGAQELSPVDALVEGNAYLAITKLEKDSQDVARDYLAQLVAPSVALRNAICCGARTDMDNIL